MYTPVVQSYVRTRGMYESMCISVHTIGIHSACVYAQVWRVYRLLLLWVNVQHHGKDATRAHSMLRNQFPLDLQIIHAVHIHKHINIILYVIPGPLCVV